MVEMQHPGSSAPLHAPPPQNELPTYEQLEASFNSVHSGTGRMFQAAALEVQQQQYTGPEAPPMGDSMADYLSTQEIHTKAMEGTKSSIMMSLVSQGGREGCVGVRVCVCVCVHVGMCIYIYMCVCVCVCVHNTCVCVCVSRGGA